VVLYLIHRVFTPGEQVARVLDRVADRYGYLASITVDNGSEFYSKGPDAWAILHQVQSQFIRPGKPVENGFIDSFNGRLRDECPNAHLVFSMDDARQKLARWIGFLLWWPVALADTLPPSTPHRCLTKRNQLKMPGNPVAVL